MVTPVRGGDVLLAAEEVEEVLEPHLAADWDVAVPELDFTVTSVVGHTARALALYSLNLWVGRGRAAFEIRVHAEAPNDRLLTSLTAGARALAAGIDTAPAGTRGSHPFGSPDPDGFAAMGCDELLVHGDDAARALSVAFDPDRELAAAVVRRLFPWHDIGDDDPWDVLLWANGRRDLRGRQHQDRWRWHCAPLAEWDGSRP
jgi:hypothetical protein